jgi:hypothetical protein
LDYGAVLAYASAAGALNPILVHMLPEVEGMILDSIRRHTPPDAE